MKLNDIKKLSRQEFVERYPFVQRRDYFTGKPLFWVEDDEAVKSGYQKTGDPCLEFYTDDWNGWNDILLCWAEKVREVFIQMPKESQDALYITDLKEKYGYLRIYLSGWLKEPFDKINDYCSMVESLSKYKCYSCGHLGVSGKKSYVSYCSTSGWVMYLCKTCAKKDTYRWIKDYGIKKEYIEKVEKANPHINLYKSVFNQDWERYSGKGYTTVSTYEDGKKITRKLYFKDLLDLKDD